MSMSTIKFEDVVAPQGRRASASSIIGRRLGDIPIEDLIIVAQGNHFSQPTGDIQEIQPHDDDYI